MKNKPVILVTGGTGYIGSHTVVDLLENNFDVEIIDDLSNSKESVLDAIEQICGKKPGFTQLDLRNELELEKFFAEKKIDAVIHFAASKAVGESVNIPLKYYKNNLLSLINLMEQMKSRSISNLVFSSSCTVYGQPEELPVTETAPILKALSPYGNTKRVGEEIIEDATLSSDLHCISLRYFNPIGAHPSALIGELPLGSPNNLAPLVTQAAIGKRETLSVYGNDYPTPDGTCIRDYIHVCDLASAHVIALKRLLYKESDSQYEVFNIGTGKGSSVMDIINTFEEVNRVQVPYKVIGRRAGDITSVFADTKKANEVLGWKATRDLKEMLESAWNWELQLKKNKVS